MKKELKRFKKVLSPDCTKRSEDQSNDERVSDVEDEEQVWSSRESFLKITLHFLKRLRQEDLADCLQSSMYNNRCHVKRGNNCSKIQIFIFIHLFQEPQLHLTDINSSLI